MKSTELLRRFRSEVQDTALPYLWTDVEIYAYMDQAQEMFCRLSFGIKDATSTLTKLQVVAGDPWVDIDPRIMKIMHAQRVSDDGVVELKNFEDFQYGQIQTDDYWRSKRLGITSDTGRVDYLIIGMSEGKGRLVKVPVVADTIEIIVERLPLEQIVTDDQELEIRKEHQEPLLLWMKHRAYGKEDSETYDRAKSDDFERAFRIYCDQALAEKERREYKPRTVAYGGI